MRLQACMGRGVGRYSKPQQIPHNTRSARLDGVTVAGCRAKARVTDSVRRNGIAAPRPTRPISAQSVRHWTTGRKIGPVQPPKFYSFQLGTYRGRIGAIRAATSLELAIGGCSIASGRERRNQSHERAVRSVPRQCIPEQVPLHGELVGDHASALLEPIVNELALVAERDQRAVDAQRLARDPGPSSVRWPKSSICHPPPGRQERGECTASPLRCES